jgi:hypothetical protein
MECPQRLVSRNVRFRNDTETSPLTFEFLCIDVTNSIVKSSWKEDPRFSVERNDSESAVAWASMNSSEFFSAQRIYASLCSLHETGFIWVENPIQKGLQPSWPEGASRQMYSIAGFHQLHCT